MTASRPPPGDDGWRLVRHADCHPMPWKNGGGETSEIASGPAGATLDTFIWRISLATVAASGDFSRFPGVDRTLVLLDGEGMTLSLGAQNIVLTPGAGTFAFSGDAHCSARLSGGATRDLNVMTRRGHATHTVHVVRGGMQPSEPAAIRMVFATEDAARCRLPSGAVELARFDSLVSTCGAGAWPAVSAHGTWLAIAISLAEQDPYRDA